MRRPFAAIAAIAIALISCRAASERSREAALREKLFEMHRYPEDLQELVSEHYLRRIPMDSITWRGTTWIEVRAGAGVIDVRSGAPGKTRDGVLYRDF